jgi:acyl carrier protein
MNIEDIKKSLYEYIKKTSDIPDDDDEYNYDVHLFDYGYLDSFGASDLMAHIEREYKIEIEQKDMLIYPMNTIQEIAEVIINKKKE